MIKFSVQMMNVGGEQSLTAPAREMLLKLIIYARRELTRNHQTTGKYNTAFNALQGYFSSVFVFCQLSQVKMLSHFHQQNSPLCPLSSPRQHTSVPDHVLFSSVQFSSVQFNSVQFSSRQKQRYSATVVPHLDQAVSGTAPGGCPT